MDEEIRCSVVMATYNGELYIAQQIESVLNNMSINDELIISDDGSTDDTRKIVQKYMENDKRIQLIDGPRKGAIKNFEKALQNVKGSVVFLCDQDDVWAEDKIEIVLSILQGNVSLVMHDATVIEEGNVGFPSFMRYRGSKRGFCHNLLKNSYIGCCMAFRRELLNYILPFPENICMHDQWIGLINELIGESRFVEDKLIQYRRHGNNASPMTGTSMKEKIKNRWNMLIAINKRMTTMKRQRGKS